MSTSQPDPGLPCLVIVMGASPGVGKSTVCRGLALALRDRGYRTDLFDEEDILTHSAFEPVARRFRETGGVDAREIIEASAAYLDQLRASPAAFVVTDALFPFVTSLRACGYSPAEVDRVVAALHRLLADFDIVTLFIDGDPAAALGRAVGERGVSWLDNLLARMRSWPSPVAAMTLDEAARYFAEDRREVLRALDATDWQPIRIQSTGRNAAEMVVLACEAVLARAAGSR